MYFFELSCLQALMRTSNHLLTQKNKLHSGDDVPCMRRKDHTSARGYVHPEAVAAFAKRLELYGDMGDGWAAFWLSRPQRTFLVAVVRRVYTFASALHLALC